MLVTLARAASGVATKRHRLGPAGEVITEGYPEGESRWALYRRDLPDLPALVGTMREIPMDTCLLRGEPAAFVPPGSLTRRRLGETLLDRPSRAHRLRHRQPADPGGSSTRSPTRSTQRSTRPANCPTSTRTSASPTPTRRAPASAATGSSSSCSSRPASPSRARPLAPTRRASTRRPASSSSTRASRSLPSRSMSPPRSASRRCAIR